MGKRKFTWNIKDCLQLIKPRLSVVVVFSASMAYLWACNRHVDVKTIWLLSIGGFLITASSNILNQVIERKSDALMKRTAQRPLPTGRMGKNHAILHAIFWGLVGAALLFGINILCGLLGVLSLLVYVLVYTPMKKISSIAVVPGAIAGSLPVVIGVVAAEGKMVPAAIILFLFQFIWQFPHTWTIAWLQNDEYNNAGLKMLPSNKKGNLPAFLIMGSTFLIIPAILLLNIYVSVGFFVTSVLMVAGLGLLMLSISHYRKQSQKTALTLMLSCLAFLPIAFIILVLEKFI